MDFYNNSLIGWFLKKKLRKIASVFIIISLIFIIFISKYTYKKSIGCNRPNCISTKCTGEGCIASGCMGINCKASDCYGEECEAGDCKGVGCRAGDCYGLNCVPGECIDPTCDGSRMLNKECIPFCFNGKAYTLPKSIAYPYTRILPKNTTFNPNFCSDKKRTGIFTDNKRIYNFEVDYVNLYTSGNTTLENLKNKDDLQTGKTYILTNDIDFKSSTPNVYKNNNCEWTTKFKDVEIESSFKPYLNEKNNEITWVAKNFLAFPIDDEGKTIPCTSDSHDMIPFYFINLRRQISEIIFKNLKEANKNFEIDSLHGDKLINICKNCNRQSQQYLNILDHPVTGYDSIKQCNIRSYEVDPILDDTGQIKEYFVNKFFLLRKDSSELNNYLQTNSNNNKTFKDHHVWIYRGTNGNNQLFRCYWCNKEVNVVNKSLPRKFNDHVGEYNGDLDNCLGNDDYNHYMYSLVDNNNTVYQKCLKCDKKSYPYQQKNI